MKSRILDLFCGADWMTNAELTQAIPPAYVRHIGSCLLAYYLEGQRILNFEEGGVGG